MSRVIEEAVFGIIAEDTVDRTIGESIGTMIIEIVVIIETGIGLERDHFQELMAVIELEVQAIVDQDQDPEPVPIGIAESAIIVENMITLQGTAPTLEKKGI